MKWVFDNRWLGSHGIGRFAVEVNRRLNLAFANLPLKPTHPGDTLILSASMMLRPSVGLFSPGYNAPLLGFSRFAFVVHDLNHIDVAHNSGLLKRLYYTVVLKRACRRAAVVLTVSNFTAARISEWSGISINKITVVGNGVSEAFHANGVRFKHGQPYFFCVGNRKGHKNEVRVIEAYARLPTCMEMSLLFNGSPTDEMQAVAKACGVEDRVHYVGRLNESELAEYYRGAVALVFPSLYEGFGLPVVESMACGTPVITSTTTSLPEVAGDAALLVDPLSVSEICNAMTSLLENEQLVDQLRRRGLIRARSYSWDDVAKRVENALIDVN